MARLWFEALPSPVRADAARIQADVGRLVPLGERPVERVLVPEVQDGDYATMDPAAFGAHVRAATGIPVSVAVCTVTRRADELGARLRQAADHGIREVVLVGGASSRISYPGPAVPDALRAHHGTLDFGVVTIPSRRRALDDEPLRLLRKQRAGAGFAVSQILLEADHALALRRDLVSNLAPGEVPVPILWSVAPVVRRDDLSFLARLGVHVPAAVGRQLRQARSSTARLELSIDVAVDVAARLADAHDAEGLGPYGFCVSHVKTGNVEAAIALVDRLVDAGLATATPVRPVQLPAATAPVPAGTAR